MDTQYLRNINRMVLSWHVQFGCYIIRPTRFVGTPTSSVAWNYTVCSDRNEYCWIHIIIRISDKIKIRYINTISYLYHNLAYYCTYSFLKNPKIYICLVNVVLLYGCWMKRAVPSNMEDRHGPPRHWRPQKPISYGDLEDYWHVKV